MNQENLQKVLEALGKSGITVNGDLVLEKHVENEIDNVEPGGIGIQKIYRGNDEHCSDKEHQVFFHRRTNGIPTENTEFWVAECRRLISAAGSGDVLVTPGVSECEKRIKNMALEQKLRMIHIQSDPIGRYWKPERSRFEACAHGSLLILAPWPEDMPATASDYERFHYLNRLAETVCAISHTTSVAVQGLRLSHGG